MRRIGPSLWSAALLAAFALTPLRAQPGVPPSSPPPDGLKPGIGAPFPKGQNAKLDSLPDWGGIWFVAFSRDPANRPTPPKLKGKYKIAYDSWRVQIAANNGIDKSARSHCSPPGMPMFMQLPQYPYEFLFTPGRVTINQEAWMQTRKIWTDGRKHEDDPDPSFYGDSIGHWEGGGTLVIDTIGLNDTLPLQTGMTHSDKLRITERIHLDPKNSDLLINDMTVDDPDALEEPWHNVISYRRDRYGKLLEFQCSENDRNPVDAQGNTLFQ